MTDILTATAGRPFARKIRILDAKDIWAVKTACEVRAQLRQGKTTATPLIANLHDKMTWEIDANDLLITWSMDGHEARAMFALDTWGKQKKGYFNIIVSDTGTEDVNAVVVPLIILKIMDTTTTDAGSL